MLVIGLTGGIGSGKTTVANLFATLGIPIIDTDLISREISQSNGKAFPLIQKAFGNEILTSEGELDRRRLRDIVFKNEDKRKTLEKILHPLIREEMAKRIEQLTSPYCIAVIPLLFENAANPLIQRTLVVDSPEALQISRTRTRDNVDEQHVRDIMKTQVERNLRLEKADDIIVNDKKLEDLTSAVKKLHDLYSTLGNAN